MRRLGLGSMMLTVACGSSDVEPIDPLAVEYCAACSELASCERTVDEALNGACPEENRAWYACVNDNSCEETACDAQAEAREICLGLAPKDRVRARIGLLAPSANLGHRGTGPTREGHPFPENSLSSFLAAVDDGADGVELDVEITQDGELIIMHDDTVDRTTTCTGCVSEMTLDEVRACRLLDGDGNPTDEGPPTLLEVYGALDDDALINVELKVFDPPCLSDTTGPEQLVSAVLAEVGRAGGEARTIFSSFDETALELLKAEKPGYYSALLSLFTDASLIDQALRLDQDAIHPLTSVAAETVQSALDAGLQVNVWTANTAESMQEQLDKGVTGIITNEPAILAGVLGR